MTLEIRLIFEYALQQQRHVEEHLTDCTFSKYNEKMLLVKNAECAKRFAQYPRLQHAICSQQLKHEAFLWSCSGTECTYSMISFRKVLLKI